MADEVLEQLFIDFLGRDDQLEAMYQQMLDNARANAVKIGSAFQAGFAKAMQATPVSASQGADFTKLGTEAEKAGNRVSRLADRFKELKGQFDSGRLSTQQYTRLLGDLERGIARTRNHVNLSATDWSKLGATMRQVQSAQANVGGSTATVNANVQRLVNRVRELRNEWQRTGKATKETKDELNRLQTEMAELSQSLREADGGWERFHRQITQLSVAGRSAEATVAGIEGRISRLGLASQVQLGVQQQIVNGLHSFGPAGSVAAGSLGLVGGSMATLSAGTLAAVGGVVALGAAAVGLTRRGIPEVKEFDSAIRVLIASGEELSKSGFNDTLRDLQAAAGSAGDLFSRSTIATSLAEIVKAGVDFRSAIDLMVPGMRLASITGQELNETTTLLLGNLRQFGAATSEAGRFADALAQADLNAAEGARELSEGLAVVGPLAAAAGLEFEDTLAILVELSNKTMSAAAEGATGLRAVFSALLDPTSEARGMLERLGVSLTTADGKARPLRDVLFDLTEALAGNSEAAQAAAKIFDTRAVTAILNVTDASFKSADALKEASGALKGYSDTLLEDNLTAAQEKLNTAIDDLAQSFTLQFADNIAAAATALAGWFGEIDRFFAAGGLEKLRMLATSVFNPFRLPPEILDQINREAEAIRARGTGVLGGIGPIVDFSQLQSSPVFGPVPRPEGWTATNNAIQATTESMQGLFQEAARLKTNLDAAAKSGNPQAWLDASAAVDAFKGRSDAAAAAWQAVLATLSRTDVAVAGSLDALQEQLKSERAAFSAAGTDAGRAFHLAIIKELEAAMQAVEDRFSDDPAKAAKAWTQRLAAELEFGLKDAATVFDLINPAIEKVRQEAASALSEFGFDSQQYRDAVAKLQVLEGLLGQLDFFQVTKTWTSRLLAEFNLGQKSAQDVLDLILPRIRELKTEAATALADFGINSQQYQEAAGKLEILEGLAQSIGVNLEDLDKVTVRGLQQQIIDLTSQGVDPASEAVQELLRQINELELRAALTELRTKGIGNLSDWAEEVLKANGLLADAVKAVDLTPIRDAVSAEVLEKPLASALFAMHRFSTEGSQELVLFRESWTDFASGVELASVQTQAAMSLSLDAFNVFMDTIKARLAEGENLNEVIEALGRSGFLDQGIVFGFPGGTAPTDTPLLQAALAAQEEAWAGVQAAMTEDQLREASERFLAAKAEVERLQEFYSSTTITGPTIEKQIGDIRDALPTDLEAAARAAGIFGDANELAARKAALLESAIRRILQLDPDAEVGDLFLEWELLAAGMDDAARAAAENELITGNLVEAQRRLAELTGEAPTEWEEMRKAFLAAAAAGKITVEQLEEILAALKELEAEAEGAKALKSVADAINFGADIAEGVTQALEGLNAGSLEGALGGLASIGATIGAFIGNPIVGAVAAAIQVLPSLFQAVSDLFTGDSPARRELAASLTQTIEGAVRSGIDAGLRGADDWRDTLRTGIRESVVGALVDAFIEAAVTQAIIAPFIDQFTLIMQKQGREAALAFLEANINAVLSAAEGAAADIVRIFAPYFDDIEDPLSPNAGAGVFELPDATVGVIAAPDWASDLTLAAADISEAGAAMLEAATLMRDTMQAGINVNNTSERGIDAHWAAQ